MKLIIGGAYQGKTEYVMQNYHLTATDIIDGAVESVAQLDAFCNCRCITHYHMFVKQQLEVGINPLEAAQHIAAVNPDVIIIMDEIGNGIIPIEKSERIWREEAGKVGCYLAKQAQSVERVVCGVSTVIKTNVQN